ncbi:hypothetical protein B0H19DRAFT_1232550 [Mycena capillaripes]|nr:hypothetical protein B0H19DRAFT_1232550 [Mycena capillaripes]
MTSAALKAAQALARHIPRLVRKQLDYVIYSEKLETVRLAIGLYPGRHKNLVQSASWLRTRDDSGDVGAPTVDIKRDTNVPALGEGSGLLNNNPDGLRTLLSNTDVNLNSLQVLASLFGPEGLLKGAGKMTHFGSFEEAKLAQALCGKETPTATTVVDEEAEEELNWSIEQSSRMGHWFNHGHGGVLTLQSWTSTPQEASQAQLIIVS